MAYSCGVCDETIKPKSKINRIRFLSINQYEKYFQTNHTIKNPDFFDMDKTFNDYITNHN